MRDPEVVVITGASAGVGRATARAFARRGARIGLLARPSSRLDDTVREVERLGGAAIAYPVDVADAEQMLSAAQAVEARLGAIDVWINNAMVTVFSPAKDMTPDEFKRVTEVTYLGYVHGTLAALRYMLPRNRGVIVQVGSALAYRSIPLQSAYCGAKFAIRGFTDALRCELLHDRSRVHVTMVQLAAMNTPQFAWARSRLLRKARPVPPIFQPEVAANAIVWAAQHRAREINVGAPSTLAIWANKFFPGLIDRYLARTNYGAQQYDGQPGPAHQDNLFTPVALGQAAHGDFDRMAHARSVQWWLRSHRRGLAFLAAGLAAAAYLRATRYIGDGR